MTLERPLPGIAAGSGPHPLQMLALGSPLSRTLKSAAVMAGNISPEGGCGILLMEDDRLALGASYNLRAEDERSLDRVSQMAPNDGMQELEQQPGTEVWPLVTAASEFVGAVVLFHSPAPLPANSARVQMEEVCAIATLALEGKHLLDELYFRAHHDALTGIWNRLWVEEKMACVLDEAAITGSHTGLMIIGIDSFRIINELLGSSIGNELLREVANRLDAAIQHDWSLARFGGDEFAILVPELASASEIGTFATRLQLVFGPPFEFGDHQLLIRATIGTSVSAPGECSAETLQIHADLALRDGKRAARSRVSPFHSSMTFTPPERLEMERHLRSALQKGEFELFYQPQIQLSTGRLLAVEALLRWRHPYMGFISPATFIPVAEEIGIIDEIGEWVMLEAIQQTERWQKAGLTDLRIAVNVSPIQFSQADFSAFVTECLKQTSLQPHHLELEITESAVMKNFDHGVRQVRLLHSLGVLIALDDFGIGHSSLAYLQQLPIQRIKIDRMFVKDMTSRATHPLLAGIIQMGRALGCYVIAEGIETAEQANGLAALDCHEVQGFFFCKPLPAAEILPWAEANAGVLCSVGKGRAH